MKNALKCRVYLWDSYIGELAQINSKVCFKYNIDCKYKNFSPIALPFRTQQYIFNNSFENGLEGAFIDCLPDSFGLNILNKYFEDNYPNFTPNVIDKLLFLSDSMLGVLRFEPSLKARSDIKPLAIELKDLRAYERNLLKSKKVEDIQNLLSFYKSFSPLAGARSKLLVNYDENSHTFFIGKIRNKNEKALILKIDESNSTIKRIDTTIEWIYSKVAKEAGLDMPQTYLFSDSNGFKHFGVERFDIDYHVISMSGLLNFDKNKRIDLRDFLEIAKSKLFLKKEDLNEIFRRVVFNYVYNNNDDHLKNHEFLMDKEGRWKLSPLFDVTYNNKIGNSNMRMTINGKNSSDACIEDFLKVASDYKIDDPVGIIEKVQSAKYVLKELVEKYISDDYYDVDRDNILSVKNLSIIQKSAEEIQQILDEEYGVKSVTFSQEL